MTAKTDATADKAAAAKPMYATRFFQDAGLERSFEQNDKVDVDDGVMKNYIAAGLVSDKKTEVAKAAAEGATA